MISSSTWKPDRSAGHDGHRDVDETHMTTTIKGTTRAQLNSFRLSDAPQTITINRATGDMISVTSGLPALDLPTVAPVTL
jgi:hypothetical protein